MKQNLSLSGFRAKKLFTPLLLACLLLTALGSCKKENHDDELKADQEEIALEVKANLKGRLIYERIYPYLLSWNMLNLETQLESTIPKNGASTWGWSNGKWSPDGSKIAFINLLPVSSIGVYNLANDETSILYPELYDPEALVQKTVLSISWSPDGKRIAVLNWTGQISVNQSIRFIDLTSGLISSFDLPSNNSVFYSEIAWNPVSDEIAIEGYKSDNSSHSIWMTPSSSIDLHLFLTNEQVNYSGLDWSPDGNKLVYSTHSNAEGNKIIVVNADGTNNHPIVLTGAFKNEKLDGFRACFGPNNEQIIYEEYRPGNNDYYVSASVFVTNINGSYKVKLVELGTNPDWH